ncbi:MAG: 50S ribosomal protein L9 [Desulfosarcina sp.]|nr:50S ribosomal protein L9 [Desulfobacterales bacterium]
MKLILKETIETLGIIGTQVDVANGYARNYLLPQGKAVLDTPQNHRILGQQKKKFDLQIAKEKKIAEEMAAQLQDISCRITARVIDDDTLYGSITSRDIVKALGDQDIKVEKRMILLAEAIKQIGSYKVPIRVYAGVEPEITVEVEPEK